MDSKWKKLLSNIDMFKIDMAMHYPCHGRLFGPVHKHDNTFHITYIVQGSCRIDIEDKTVNVAQGHVVFIRPDITHYSYDTDKRFYELMECKFSTANSKAIKYMPQLPDVLKIQNQAPFVSAFERIVMRKKLTESSNDGLLLTYLLEIMMLIDSESKISRQTSGHESELKRNINQAARYIATSYNEPLTVEKLSETVGMSPSYFASVFTKMMKVSPIEMLIRTRIYHARELLRHTDLTVSEIAQLCGFCSSQYFARTFLKRQNLTPTEYRERSR